MIFCPIVKTFTTTRRETGEVWHLPRAWPRQGKEDTSRSPQEPASQLSVFPPDAVTKRTEEQGTVDNYHCFSCNERCSFGCTPPPPFSLQTSSLLKRMHKKYWLPKIPWCFVHPLIEATWNQPFSRKTVRCPLQLRCWKNCYQKIWESTVRKENTAAALKGAQVWRDHSFPLPSQRHFPDF